VIKGFKDFLLRGNVIDLAVAVVIGVAFGLVITAFSRDFIGGLIGALGGSPNFDDAGFDANGSRVIIGTTITALINFLIVAAVIYFVVVVPVNKLMERRKRGEEPEVATPTEDILLLQEIRDLLREQRSGTGGIGGTGSTRGTGPGSTLGGGPTI
jgi:large conductance mechanosensitive channel